MSLRLVFLIWVVSLIFLSGSVNGGEKRSKPEKSSHTDRYGDALPQGAVARLGTMRLRHEGPIGALAFSPDGKVLASGGTPLRLGRARIHLWDPITGKQIRAFADEATRGVSSLVFSPDGKTLASLGDYQVLFGGLSHRGGQEIPFTKIHLWDTASGKHRLTLAEHTSYVTSVAFSADGKLLASASADNTIRLWETDTGNTIRVIHARVHGFYKVFVTPDGKSLVTSSGDNTIRLWDVVTGKQIRIIKSSGGCSTLHLSRDGKIAASSSVADDKIRLWDLASGKQLGDCSKPETSGFWCFGPDKESLFLSVYDQRQHNNQLYMWDWKNGKKVRGLEGRPIHITAAAFSPGGQTLAVADSEAIRLWNMSTGKEVTSLARHLSGVGMVISPDGRTIATVGNDRTIRLWELPSGKPLQVWREREVSSVAFSPDGKFLAWGGKQMVRLWDIKSSRNIRTFNAGENDSFIHIGFCPDGKTLVGHSWTGKFYLWNVKSGKELKRLDVQAIMGAGPVSIFLGVKKLACLPMKNANGIYDLDFGSLICRFTDSEVTFLGGRLYASAFSPDGNFLVTANSYHGIYLREAVSGQIISSVKITAQGPRVQLLPAPPGDPMSSIINLAVSPDSRYVAAGYDNGKVILWDLLRGKELHAFHGHTSHVTLAFTPDGKYLVTGSLDSTALVWEVPDIVRHPQRKGKALTDGELRALDSDLSGSDARNAFLAIESLASAPAQAVPLLRRRLRPIVAVDAKRVTQLIADLDSDRFVVREAAMRELAKLGDRAEAQLRSTLADKPTLEARRRIEELLRTMKAESLYASRAILVLERIGTPEARQVLQDLTKGDAEAWQTRTARAALKRIAQR